MLAQTVLKAPFAGTITVRHREPGEALSPGTPVLTIRNFDDRWVRVYIPGDEVGRLTLGQPAIDHRRRQPENDATTGRVSYIASVAEFTPRNVQSTKDRVKLVYEVRVRIAGDTKVDLKPGLPADVRFTSPVIDRRPLRIRAMHRTDRTATRRSPRSSVVGLTRTFGDLKALDALSFDVAAGELFGIVGPDGSGKTTTLRILAGVLRPTAGDATVVGTSVAKDPEGVKHRIAYMSQRFGLYGDLTVRENIEFYADLYGVPRKARAKRLERLYAFSQLGQFEKRLAGALSGGMKQKLSLCCALIHEPEVLLLDEPTFGVDPISRRELWLIVHEMVANGMTAIVSTAYLDEAERCDRVALLNKGKLAALDTPVGAAGQATRPHDRDRLRFAP